MQSGYVGSQGEAVANVEGLVSGVREGVERDIAGLPAEFRRSGLAATALAMADELDDEDNSATAKSMCAGKLIDALERLRALVPEKAKETKLDDIAKRREQRLARAAGS